MKLAHAVIVTPGRCGLYETTRELVTALRDRGIDSRMIDPKEDKVGGDRGAIFADHKWAEGADLIVNHSGLGSRLEALDTPVVHVLHGRPRSSFLVEMNGTAPIYSYHYTKNKDARWKAVVTFWSQHLEYHRVMWPQKPLHYIPAPVDLERWTPDGPSGYNWHGMGGEINAVITDAWRYDVDPFAAVHAFALRAREQKGMKLHIYGADKKLKAWAPLLKQIQDDGNLGQVMPWVDGLGNVYRAADFLITPHTIDTRAVREAMACGCPVVRVNGTLSVDGMTKATDEARQSARADAERLFDPAVTARLFEEICDGCI